MIDPPSDVGARTKFHFGDDRFSDSANRVRVAPHIRQEPARRLGRAVRGNTVAATDSLNRGRRPCPGRVAGAAGGAIDPSSAPAIVRRDQPRIRPHGPCRFSSTSKIARFTWSTSSSTDRGLCSKSEIGVFLFGRTIFVSTNPTKQTKPPTPSGRSTALFRFLEFQTRTEPQKGLCPFGEIPAPL